jgi:hypothetical protein
MNSRTGGAVWQHASKGYLAVGPEKFPGFTLN